MTSSASNSTSAKDEDTNNQQPVTRQGKCYCGKVSISVTGPPVMCSICHCSICRSLTGAPFSAQSLHARSNMECNTPEDALWAQSTSKPVTRYRCRECASPMYASLGKGKMVAIPLSVLFRRGMDENPTSDDLAESDAALFQPTHHMYYADRIMNVPDELPKYVGTSAPGRGVLWTPKEE